MQLIYLQKLKSPLSEMEKLRVDSHWVLLWLVAILIVNVGGAAFYLYAALPVDFVNPVLSVVAGTLGSTVAALVSVLDRIANGWEFSNGDKYPNPEPGQTSHLDKFSERMEFWFIARPFLGSAMGLSLYAGLKGGFLITVQNASQATFNPEALFFLAFVAGLFAKTLIDKLKSFFEAFVGKGH